MSLYNRRGFIKRATAAMVVALHPSWVRRESTQARQQPKQNVCPPLIGDGIHDDTLAIQCFIDNASPLVVFPIGTFLVREPLTIPSSAKVVTGGVIKKDIANWRSPKQHVLEIGRDVRGIIVSHMIFIYGGVSIGN